MFAFEEIFVVTAPDMRLAVHETAQRFVNVSPIVILAEPAMLAVVPY